MHYHAFQWSALLMTLDDARPDVLTAVAASSDAHRPAEDPTTLPTRQLCQTLDDTRCAHEASMGTEHNETMFVLSMQVADKGLGKGEHDASMGPEATPNRLYHTFAVGPSYCMSSRRILVCRYRWCDIRRLPGNHWIPTLFVLRIPLKMADSLP